MSKDNNDLENSGIILFSNSKNNAEAEGYVHPISTAVGKVVIAVPLILKLLELQKIMLNSNHKLEINSNLKEIRSIDMLMVKRLEPTTENIEQLEKGRYLINSIKEILDIYIKEIPSKDSKLTLKGIIEDAINKDLVGSMELFRKKINNLLKPENPIHYKFDS